MSIPSAGAVRVAIAALLALLVPAAAAFPAGAPRAGGVALAQPASGVHEGRAGPFRVSVEVVPALPLAGKVQFLVRPVEAASGLQVRDAEIEVFLSRDGRDAIKTPALNSQADRTTYVGNAEPDRPGDWEVRVEVRSAAGEGAFTFTMEVRPRARSGEGLVAPTMVYLGAAVVIVAGIAWLVRASRRARAALDRNGTA